MGHRHTHPKNPFNSDGFSSVSRIVLEESGRRKRRGGLTNIIMSPAAAQMNTHVHSFHTASSCCWLLSVGPIVLSMNAALRLIAPTARFMSSTLGQTSSRRQILVIVMKACPSPSITSVYAGETNPAARAVRNARAKRRNIIKTMKRAGRKSGRRGTTVPNSVLIAPAEDAIVVAVVVS